MAMSLTSETWKPNSSNDITNTKNTTTSMKGAMPSSALPHTTELREEDDWTKVKDPKEKKRIQNRVAQRTYRHRMKARLGELQARLESHEARKSQNPEATDSPTIITTNSFKSHVMADSTAADGSPTIMGDKPDQIPQQPLPPAFMQQPNLYEQPVDDPENSLFPQLAPNGILSSPPPSQPSPPTTHGLLSPPTHADQQQTHDPRGGKPQDFMVDCLRFQSQLLSRLNDLQQETGFPGSCQTSTSMPSQMSQSDQVNCVSTFEDANRDGMDFSFEASADMWKTDSAPKMQQPSPDSTYLHTLTPAASSAGGSIPAGASGMRTRKPSQNATLDERFECIMEQVEAAGFESFDAMTTAYYTQTFGESSPLADEQRLSRNRRLPQVLSDVYGSANGWTDWERKGFQDEILKTAETMLTSEGCDARQSLSGTITSLVEAQDNGDPAAATEAMASMKRTVQEKLPNSWALTMAMAADGRQSWQRDRSNTALASTLLLNFSGRVPNDQLLRVLGTCL